MKQTGMQRGFTLVELMIAVTILAIVAAIAVPSYRNSTLKSKRQNGIQCLVELQKRMEDYYGRNNQYPTLPQVGYAFVSGSSSNCPAAEGKPLYTVALTTYTMTPSSSCNICYQLQATGVGKQAQDGALVLGVDPRNTAPPSEAYHKMHITPATTPVYLDGWIFSPGH
jgi:type IV pilus assembly protein PilE